MSNILISDGDGCIKFRGLKRENTYYSHEHWKIDTEGIFTFEEIFLKGWEERCRGCSDLRHYCSQTFKPDKKNRSITVPKIMKENLASTEKELEKEKEINKEIKNCISKTQTGEGSLTALISIETMW